MALSLAVSRRQFLSGSATGIGTAALFSLLQRDGFARAADQVAHHRATAKRVIYLFQSGAPSQVDLFDYKPLLEKLHGQELPDDVRRGQRLTTMTAGQSSFPLNKSPFAFQRVGQSGATISELLPFHKRIVDDLCIVQSMHTEAINHDPAITFFQTGSQIAGRPSMGAWLSYALGSENENLPGFMVLLSRGSGRPNAQPLYDRLWSAGFLPSRHQGVKLRSQGDPILYLNNPRGVTSAQRRRFLSDLNRLNRLKLERTFDPEIETRIAQYEMTGRMQSAVPDILNVSDEPQHVLDRYGPDVKRRGSYAWNCLLARRLAERDVRFIQLYHIGWDQHDKLLDHHPKQCRDTDQPSAALIADLKERGLLDDTLVIWGGEFGRTVYTQGKIDDPDAGRDHHPRCFSIWLSGGGIKTGMTYGKTDEFSYNIVENPLHVHDLQATLLHCLGLDHKRLTFRYQGRDFRLTDVHGKVIRDILA